ncbi:MAG TPA: hypothetical protein PLG77_08830 [Burkholderiaceae bacterium]|nr:hypothetical protein [Burkholderiaceae bacterium]
MSEALIRRYYAAFNSGDIEAMLACLAEGEGVVSAELDPQRIASVRRRLPALAHRRADLAGAPDAAR